MLSRQLLRSRAAAATSSASAVISATFSSSPPLMCCFRATAVLRLRYENLDESYYQESFEALQRFQQSKTYPGSIKAATPGDTAHFMTRYNTLLDEGDRHYWRAVVDDPEPRRYLTIRVRFKEDVCIGDRFEVHSSVVPVSVPADCTIAHLMQAVRELNDSPYLCENPFTLSLDGKVLAGSETLCAAGVSETTVLDAADDVRDHRMHEDGSRMLDWYRDEMTPDVENTAPYAELKLRENTVAHRKSPKAYRMYGKASLARHGSIGAQHGLVRSS